ncbi:MAG: galactokinase [Clostridiales bacterium]|nr:galactokinase [Clostridiales bacterium]
MEKTDLKKKINEGTSDGVIFCLYGSEKFKEAKERCLGLVESFKDFFGYEAESIFSAPGRTEIGGNHTDHQHGRVLAASVDLDILAAVKPNGVGAVRLKSEGRPFCQIKLSELEPKKGELNSTEALIRGVAAGFKGLGCEFGDRGFDAYVISDVPGGSGLSSSAAFEVLVGTIINHIFFEGKVSAVETAKIGGYAENVFFGKPSGLMDQTASAVGGVCAIDFIDPKSPKVKSMELDLKEEGYALCILDSKADHADLTDEYAAITVEMGEISGYFGKTVLREVEEETFLRALPELRKRAGDRAVLRAFHFFSDNRDVLEETQALKAGNFDGFLELVRASGISSAMYLQNIIPAGQIKNQELMIALGLAEKLLEGKGAFRVHGGGFGGTAQAFVPLDMVNRFKEKYEAVFGEGSCRVVNIRNYGGIRVI